MTIGCFNACDMGSATVRATMSVPLPAVNGTIMWIGFSGHSAAAPSADQADSAAMASVSFFIDFSSVSFERHGKQDQRGRRAAVHELARLAGRDTAGIMAAQHGFLRRAAGRLGDDGHFAFEHHVMLLDAGALEVGMAAGLHARDAHPERRGGAGFAALEAH